MTTFSLSYAHGSSAPPAILTLPGAGTLDSNFDSWQLEIQREVLGGDPVITIPYADIDATATDEVTVLWAPDTLGGLDVGVYGLVFTATAADGTEAKWDGSLEVRPA